MDFPCISAPCWVSLCGGWASEERRPLSISYFCSFACFCYGISDCFSYFSLLLSFKPPCVDPRHIEPPSLQSYLHLSGPCFQFLFASHPPRVRTRSSHVPTIRRYYSLSYRSIQKVRILVPTNEREPGGSEIYAPQIRSRGDPFADRTKFRL